MTLRAAYGAPLHVCPGITCAMCRWFLRIYNREAQKAWRVKSKVPA